ncbi:hypothetical protein B1J93_15295 [Leptospira kirschneri serovar Pomona]|uniref:Uncharacterized protein n=1 Tax=Leptospira kirschneri serovar Pomona TaxID=561005 RepID=A0A1T1DJD5_9LEPT|nr:hypothetical protein B1J93_15295 [Leptospira kirschneri serovar Pomona]
MFYYLQFFIETDGKFIFQQINKVFNVFVLLINYIIKYLTFCMKPVFCDKINGTQFYRDQ